MASRQKTLTGYGTKKSKGTGAPKKAKPEGPKTRRTESRRVYSHSIVNRVTTTTRQGNQTRSTSTWTKISR